MQCDKCGNKAVIFQPYSGRHLCREHLAADIGARIKRDIRKNHWMRPGDNLAVALSGNGSTRALLTFFHNLTARRRDIQLSAIVIDEGIAGHRDVPEITKLADTLGIPCHVGSFRNEFRLSGGDGDRDSGGAGPCIRCRQLRRTLIETIARREGITRIISGRTLEDRAGGILENILTGQVENLLPDSGRTGSVPWIDPMGSVPREEADMYADILCPGGNVPPCPDRETGFSGEVKDLLEKYTRRHPATPYSVSVIGNALRSGCRPTGPETEVRSHAA